MKQVSAVILAAGGSTRFGRPKQLLDWGGVPFVARVADVALSSGLAPVIVVLGCQADAAGSALGTRPVRVVMNWRWKEGLSTSVKTGLAALPPTTEAAIFLQCDQPLITVDLLRTLAARFGESGAPIVHPVHAGQRSTPVLFARQLFPELATVSGDEGGRRLIDSHSKDVSTVEVADPDILTDVDTPVDYERLRASTLEAPTSKLQGVAHLIIDMDGVLWHGEEPLPGLREFFAFLRRHQLGFVLATNNSSKTPEQHVAKLARVGIKTPIERVLTSAQATASYLGGIASPGTHVYAIGEEGVQRALQRQGFELTEEEAAYVVVGWDRHLTWHQLKTAALLVHAGAGFIGTNPDASFPTELGPVPGNGAQLAALEATTGVTPIVVGKPEPWLYQEALQRMGADAATTAIIGDRLDTDIAGGVRAGLKTVLVLSGISTKADLANASAKPDLVCADIKALMRIWDAQTSEQRV